MAGRQKETRQREELKYNEFAIQSSAESKVILKLVALQCCRLEHKEVRRGGQIFMTSTSLLPTGISHWMWEDTCGDFL